MKHKNEYNGYILREGQKFIVYISNGVYTIEGLSKDNATDETGTKWTISEEKLDEYTCDGINNVGIVSIEIDIDSNMIPIKYNDSLLRWEKADKSNSNNDWYNYNNFQWANMVLVNADATGGVSESKSRAEYINAPVGTQVKEEDILAYYVWIPRYRYKLFNVTNEDKGIPVEQIEIEFENVNRKPGCGDKTRENGSVCTGGITPYGDASRVYSSGINGQWLTHPAFRFGDKEVGGFWIGKFELTGGIANPTILPNQSPQKSQRVSQLFTTIQLFNNEVNDSNYDSHMMKNIEWGALAYLFQSQYGKNGNSNYTGALNLDKELYINNYYVSSQTLTGCSGGSPTAGEKTTAPCSYPYPSLDKKATGASSTGTIYGVYDMSGGVSECVMGNMASNENNYLDHSINAGSAGDIGIFLNKSAIPNKYFDIYMNDASSSTTHNRGYLGDATKEILKTYGNSTGGWYSDDASFAYSSSVWFNRGGSRLNASRAGAFNFNSADGNVNSAVGSRAILILE